MLGALTLSAGSGVVLLNDQLSLDQSKPVVINADSSSPYGDGTLTIGWLKTMNTNNGNLTITCWDFDLETYQNGFVNASAGAMALHASKFSQSVGLGYFNKDMHISDTELGYINSASLEIGSILNGDITVANVTEVSSDAIGTLTLVATQGGHRVAFSEYHSAFNKGITVQAMQEIIVPASSIDGPHLVTQSSPTTLSTGTGKLRMEIGTSLSTTDQALLITASDFELIGSITTGTAPLEINCFDVSHLPGANAPDMNLGDLSGGLAIDSVELRALTATGAKFGGPHCGNINAAYLNKVSTDKLSGIVTLIASNENVKVNFKGNAQLFVVMLTVGYCRRIFNI